MTGYELSRAYFDWAFVNPTKIRPIHTAIYFYAIEICNRLGWKSEFSLPTAAAKEALGIKSYNAYIRGFNDLVDWGFINLIQKSKNQNTANIIALSLNDKAGDKALDRATVALSFNDKAKGKQSTKQREGRVQSKVTVDKPITNNQLTNNQEQGIVFPFDSEEFKNENENELILWPSFEDFWNLYDKKINKADCQTKWAKLSQVVKEEIMTHLAEYVKATEKEFRKHPETYLNKESWKDEIIIKNKQNGKSASSAIEGHRRRSPSYAESK